MTRSRTLSIVSLLAFLVLLVAGVAQAGGGTHTQTSASTCTRHGKSTKCQTSSTPTPTPTPTPTGTPSPSQTSSTPTPTPTATSTPTSTRTPSPSPTATPTSATPTPSPTPTATGTAVPGTCTDANAYVGSSGQRYVWDNWSSGPVGSYYADADLWATSGYTYSQHTVICNYNSWYVQATADNSSGDGAVKSYPNVHKDFIDWGTGVMPLVSSFHSITSDFANTAPGQGIYDTAYDIWFNHVGGSSTSNEVMVWTDNPGGRQTPAGAGATVVDHVTMFGRSWDVWATRPDASGAGYIALTLSDGSAWTSGSIDVLALDRYLEAKVVNGYPLLPANTKLGQIDYGVEVVSTNAQPQRWDFTNFAVSAS